MRPLRAARPRPATLFLLLLPPLALAGAACQGEESDPPAVDASMSADTGRPADAPPRADQAAPPPPAGDARANDAALSPADRDPAEPDATLGALADAGGGVDRAGSSTDAEPDAEPDPDGGGPAPFACLPDGAGRIVFRCSGGLEVDAQLGNDAFCGGYPSDGGPVILSWVLPAEGTDLKASVMLEVANLPAGATGGRTATLQAAIAGEKGDIWRAENGCTVDITGNARLGVVPNLGVQHKITGAARCPGAITGIRPGGPPITVQAFEFTTSVYY